MQFGLFQVLLAALDRAHRHGDHPAPVADRFRRVDDQVHHDLPDLARVRLDRRQTLLQVQGQGRLLRDRGLDEVRHLLDQISQRHPLHREDRLAGVRKHLEGQIGGALRRGRDLGEVPVGGGPRRDFVEGQLGVPENDREEIVEIVCDPAGQGSQRLHLLGVVELLLQHPFVSAVPEDPQQKFLPFKGNQGRGNISEEHGTVFLFHWDVCYRIRPTRGPSLESSEDIREAFFRMEVQDPQVCHLLFAVPEHFANLSVPHLELHAFFLDHENPVTGVVEDDPEFLLRFLESFFPPPALGDVAEKREESVMGRREIVHADFHVPQGTVLASV